MENRFRLIAFTVTFSLSAFAGTQRFVQSQYDQPKKLVAVGDIHGDVEALISILKARRLIEWDGANWKWIGDKAHVVLVGDLVDRGPDSRAVLDFLYDMEAQAEEKGGKIHPLIGNHELMLLTGDDRYLSPTDKERFKRFDPKHGFVEALRSASSPYGRDLRNRNSMVKIGDTLFVHAGLGKSLVKSMSLEQMDTVNREVREWISAYQKAHAEGKRPPRQSGELKRYLGNEGPFWTRAMAEGRVAKTDIKALLDTMKIKRVVIGHTFDENRPWIRERYDARVINLDTGNSREMEGVLSAIEITSNGVKFYDEGKIPRLCPKYFKKLSGD